MTLRKQFGAQEVVFLVGLASCFGGIASYSLSLAFVIVGGFLAVVALIGAVNHGNTGNPTGPS